MKFDYQYFNDKVLEDMKRTIDSEKNAKTKALLEEVYYSILAGEDLEL